MYKKISDYGIIGNLHTVALVGRDGSIDWLCLPHIDSPSVFAAILDADDGGSFSITPDGEWDSVISYMEDCNVLVGQFRTRTGAYTVTDFMPLLPQGGEAPGQKGCSLVRLLQVQRGKVRVRVRFEPRFDYGRAKGLCRVVSGGGVVVASGGGEQLALSSPQRMEQGEGFAEGVWELAEGERVALHLQHGVDEPKELSEQQAETLLLDTIDFWREWLYRGGTGFYNDLGPHREQVIRSLLVLKLLFYRPQGTMAAAATTSLPESIGGERNWDYRFSWVRDTSMALTALFQVGHVKETQGYLDWLKEIIVKSKRKELQVMYRLDGSTEIQESKLPHLEGFRGSSPVRVGNGAAVQKQFSIYGHVLIAAHLLVSRRQNLEPGLWEGLSLMCEFARTHWGEPDWSIWEMRTPPRHYVHSKVMCWVTLDRGLRIARARGLPWNREWEESREEIRGEVMAKGWSAARQAFVLHYGSDALDGSALLMSMSGFISYDDPRMIATVEALRLDLSAEGFLYRYLADDGLPGKEGTFLACTLWLITNLAKQGELEEAELLLMKVDQLAGPLHLLAEEYDPEWQEQLGNFPQAFSHEAYITAATAIAHGKGDLRRRPAQEEYLLPGRDHGGGNPPLAEELARTLDEARGSWLDPERRPALTEQLRDLLGRMERFDLTSLKSREEKTSFWCNLFTLLVLHGVLALEIRESVKEVARFYRRVGCRIGQEIFTCDVILNGILRGNRSAPGRFIPPLPPGDSRLARSLRPGDPRIHFVIWTGTASSPPMRALRPETADAELDRALRWFVQQNSTLDLAAKRISLPRIFKWYDDFGKTSHDIAVFAARCLDEEAGRVILADPQSFRLDYHGYDWRLPCRDRR